jgi:ubiquinone/menaquinone biosynthesis C-methylase UbiE
MGSKALPANVDRSDELVTMIDLNKTAKARAKWDKNARMYDLMHRLIENKRTILWFAKLWGSVQGPQVLEVGVGTGKSFAFYPSGLEITAIDFSRGMLTRAERKAHQLGVHVNLKQMDVQSLEFADNSFDTVVTSCVFCSVPDPVMGLQEIRRILKPDGRLVLLEHMRHSNEFVGKVMDLLNPLVMMLSGPAINRRTLDNLRLAGMEIEALENLGFGGIVKLIIARPAKNSQPELHEAERK